MYKSAVSKVPGGRLRVAFGDGVFNLETVRLVQMQREDIDDPRPRHPTVEGTLK